MKTLHCGRTAVLLLVLAGSTALFADNSQSMRLSLYSSLAGLQDNTLSLSGLGEALLSIEAEGDRNVRAEFQLSATTFNASTPQNFAVTVPKAFVRVRFPGLRLIAGRTRLSWGEGVFFNAGDILFGSSSTGTDLLSEVLRSETGWLLSSWHSLGQYSYIETVILPPAISLPDAPRAEDLTAGFRAETQIAGIRTQAGYAWNGAEETHVPFLSLQGNLYVDWYAAVRTEIRQPDAGESLKDSAEASFGLFHIQDFTEGGSLTARLEGLVRPWGVWQERVPEQGGTGTVQPLYGLLFYPEVSWAPSQFLSFQARSIVSPLDASALFSLGGFWKPYQGLTLLGFLTVQAGDRDDLYGFDRDGGYAFTTGIRYAF